MRVLSSSEYERMTNRTSGKWYTDYEATLGNEFDRIKELKEQGHTVKAYHMTTSIRGYYDTIILVKR